jgi:hypothetical protein
MATHPSTTHPKLTEVYLSGLYKEDPTTKAISFQKFKDVFKINRAPVPNAKAMINKMELQKEFYDIITELEDNIVRNKQKLFQDINNPVLTDKSTKQWIRREFESEYQRMSIDYDRRYSIRIEKIFMHALKVNPLIPKDLALVTLRLNAKFLHINEFEAFYIVKTIQLFSWQFRINDFGRQQIPRVGDIFTHFCSMFNFPPEFLKFLENSRADQQLAKETFFNIFVIFYAIKNFLNQRYVMNILELYLEDKLNVMRRDEVELDDDDPNRRPGDRFTHFINFYLQMYWFEESQ